MKNDKRISVIAFDVITVVIVCILCIIILAPYLFPRIFGNKTMIDFKYQYNKAITSINGEKIEIEIDTWKDYEGEQIQIISKDGKVYLLSSFNTLLIGE